MGQQFTRNRLIREVLRDKVFETQPLRSIKFIKDPRTKSIQKIIAKTDNHAIVYYVFDGAIAEV